MTCPQCGANLSDQLNSCPECHAQITVKIGKQYCANCKTEIVDRQNFCYFCGQRLVAVNPPPLTNIEPISVEDVLGSSLNIMKREPVILAPMLVEFVTSIALTRFLAAYLQGLAGTVFPDLPSRFVSPFTQFLLALTVAVALGITLQPIVYGTYPLMVKNAVDGCKVDFLGAFRNAAKRLPSLLVAQVLVGLKVFIGTLLFIIPGLYWLMGYYVTIPAVMLRDLGGRRGMSASMSFSRHRKWKIFGLLLITSPPASLGPVILQHFLGNPVPIVASTIFDLTIGLVLNVLGVVMCSYTYIRYGIEPFNQSSAKLDSGI